MPTPAPHCTRPDVHGLAVLLQAWPDAALVAHGSQVLLANAAARALLGRKLEGRTLQQLLPLPAGFDLLPRQPEQTLACPITLTRAGGASCKAELCARCIGHAHGQPLALVTVHEVHDPQHETSDALRVHPRHAAAGLHIAHEDERRRIAIELHDELQQLLAAMHMELHLLGGQLSDAHPQAAESLGRLGLQAQRALASTRRIVNDLRPPMLEDLGLVPALEALATQFAQRSGVACSLQAALPLHDPAALPPVLATALYRCAQEALANVARHAGARHAAITLTLRADGRVALRVSDDGRGLQQGDRSKPMTTGLRGMQQRVHALGGQLQLRSRAGHGTTVLAILNPVTP